MRQTTLLSLFILLAIAALAQETYTPQVPSRMQFADLQLKITEAARKEIQADVDALTASAKFFQAKVDRAALYMPLVEQVFEEEGLPEDFKYLAIQESGFISDAVSTSNAVGFWQFKKLTADEVGLKVDRRVDERQNIIASTRGAAKYLQKNNYYFNNWLYALQAYQMGAGGAMDALGNVKGGEKRLTIDKRTYWYVKKYLAHKIAFERAVEKAKGKQPALAVYNGGGGKSLKSIADDFNVEEEELKELNTWLLARRIPEDKEYAVIVPSRGSTFSVAALSPPDITPKTSTTSASSSSGLPPVREIPLGEDVFRRITLNGLPGVILKEEMTVDELAELLNMESNDLISYNDLLPHSRIIVGQIYYMKSKRKKGRIYYHTVQPGESVWMIAQNYGVKISSIMRMNRIENKDYTLENGRILWLKKRRPASVPIEYWPSDNSGDD